MSKIIEAKFDEIQDVQNDYNQPEEKELFINQSTNETRIFNDLTPWEKLKYAADKYSLTINNPNQKCKKCFGRGYTGFEQEGENRIPFACRCIFPKDKK